MQAKKSTKVLSALAMAVAGAASAHMAHAATLTLYYGEDTYAPAGSGAGSNNGIFVSTGYNASSLGNNAKGQPTHLTGVVTPVASVPGAPVTVNVPVGDYLSLAIDAVLTGNVNASPGNSADTGVPSFLGFSSLGISVASTDATGVMLTGNSVATAPSTTIAGLPSYVSTGVINNKLSSNGANALAATPTFGTKAPGDVQPNLPGYDTAPNSSGGIGLGSTSPTGGAFPFGGNTGNSGTNPSGQFSQFASDTNTASYLKATDFIDNLTLKALSAGSVTLSPHVVAGATQYYTYAGAGTASNSTYAAHAFGGSDVLGTLPVIVVNVVGPATGHPIVNYAGAANSSYAPTIGTLTVTGGHGSYTVASMTGLNGGAGDGIGTTEAVGFNPASDEEIWALDVLVNGSQASPTQLATLITEIGSFSGGSTGIVATTQSPVPNPFGSGYNLYLDPQGFSPAFLGLDLTSANDPALSGYTFSAIAVVPEPMTLGLLALGGVGLLSRRHRRKV